MKENIESLNPLEVTMEGRVKTTVVLEEKTTFLESTTEDVPDWTVKGRTLKGGEKQLYKKNVKVKQTVSN